jgi:uncharacterized SAM-dependent methyltransferase
MSLRDRARLVLPGLLRQQSRMSSVVQVAIHPSQFPEQVRRDLLESRRARVVNHKFHYDSARQTQKWLALHEAYSPARNDDDCLATYDRSFVATARRMEAKSVHLIGLGAGGGQKDTRLLELLRRDGKEISYTASDVSTAMVLTARKRALSVVPAEKCRVLVCDLATAENLAEVLAEQDDSRAARLITFFGMIPNFEPQLILPRLAVLVRPEDYLLFSANLAPGGDYAAGVQRVLPLYDNELTRDWLMTFLLDLGVEREDGSMRFVVEDDAGLKRIAAHFHFDRARKIRVEGEDFEFHAGERIRLFFSYRHTPELVKKLLRAHKLTVLEQWVTKSEEEGVFLCRREG